MSTTLTGKNQVTIPAELVREMGLEPGAKLEWLKGDLPGVIIIKVQPSIRQQFARAQEMGAEIRMRMGPDWDPVAQLIEGRQREDREVNGEV